MTTLERVKQVLARLSGVTLIDDDASLAAHTDAGGLALDSLDRIHAAMEIEEEFGLAIPDDDIDRPELGTVAGLAAYLDQRLAPPVPRDVEDDGFITAHVTQPTARMVEGHDPRG